MGGVSLGMARRGFTVVHGLGVITLLDTKRTKREFDAQSFLAHFGESSQSSRSSYPREAGWRRQAYAQSRFTALFHVSAGSFVIG